MRRPLLALPFLLVSLVPGAAYGADLELSLEGVVEPSTTEAPLLGLRTENGCAHDATLRTTKTGGALSVSLGVDDLADVFACAIDAEAGDDALPTITVAPAAEVSTADGLALDPTFAVVAADLDPRAGHLVRFNVNATDANDAVEDARITLDGTTYTAIVAPSEEGSGVATSAVFDVPARAWASAVVTGSIAHVDVKLDGGMHRAMTLRPTTQLDTIADEAHDLAR